MTHEAPDELEDHARTIADPAVYLRALAGCQNPGPHGGDRRVLDDFARHWERSAPPGLALEDLCSLAWYHQDAPAFQVFATHASPNVHLLLVLAHQEQANPSMFGQWNRTAAGLFAPSLAPWRNCLAQAAITSRQSPAAISLLSTIGVDHPLPARVSDIGHWLWKADPGADPRFDYTRPLHLAICRGDFQTAAWLLEQGADPWQQDSDERNALHALDDTIRQIQEGSVHLRRSVDLVEFTQMRQQLNACMEGEVLDLGTASASDSTPHPRRL